MSSTHSQPSTGCSGKASSSSPPRRRRTARRDPDAAHHQKGRSHMSTDLKLEVVVLPVSDVDRAKRFYEGLGWRLDADFKAGANWRVVQLTPPGSPCSIH